MARLAPAGRPPPIRSWKPGRLCTCFRSSPAPSLSLQQLHAFHLPESSPGLASCCRCPPLQPPASRPDDLHAPAGLQRGSPAVQCVLRGWAPSVAAARRRPVTALPPPAHPASRPAAALPGNLVGWTEPGACQHAIARPTPLPAHPTSCPPAFPFLPPAGRGAPQPARHLAEGRGFQ